MILGPFLSGVLAAAVVSLPRFFRSLAPHFNWSSPWLLLVVVFVGVALWRLTRPYLGISDLFAQIHRPDASSGSPTWGARGFVSFLFALGGAILGPEGAAIEVTLAQRLLGRSRSQRWSEQIRRTDVGVALAAGISAAFGAPLGGFLLVVELGMGGRTLSAGVAALGAFVAQRMLFGALPYEGFDLSGALYGFHFNHWRHWVAVIVLGAVGGILAVGMIRLILFLRKGLLKTADHRPWIRWVIGGLLLFALSWARRGAWGPIASLLEQILWTRKALVEVTFVLVLQTLGLSVFLASFGSMGIFWPLFGIGGAAGFLIHGFSLGSAGGFGAAAGLMGAAALWGGVLGTPLAAAVVCYELTQNFYLLLPCLIAAVIARAVRRSFKTNSLFDEDLSRREVPLHLGRMRKVMDSITAAQAMISDHEVVLESDAVAELHSRLLHGRYPFLPVVNQAGQFLGLLTVDLIEDAWKAEDPLAANSPLARLLEAKDLLYRAGQKTPCVRPGDLLSTIAHQFEEFPCLPVVEGDGRVIGLLFIHNVRLAYEREVARSALVHTPLKG